MPEFRCWIPEADQDLADAKLFTADDAQLAAEECIRDYERWANEYNVASGNQELHVHVVDNDHMSVWRVWGDPQPTYSSARVDR